MMPQNKMKVVILCGGLGTRLREETEFRPKPMVHIGDRPILWHIMKIYAFYGFNDFILALGYKSEMIKEYFYHYELHNSAVTIKLGHPTNMEIHKCHDEVGWNVTMVDTGERSLKGARLKRLQYYIDNEVFMMTYGDGLANINVVDLLQFHKSHGKIATLSGVNPLSRFGELKLRGDEVERFMEKPQNSQVRVSGGFFVFNKEIFNYLCDSDDCDLEIGPLQQLAKDKQLMVYRHDGFWACMDTMRDMEFLNKLWVENKAAWKIW